MTASFVSTRTALFWALLLFAVILFLPSLAHAASTGGSGLEWETPLQKIRDSVTGPVAARHCRHRRHPRLRRRDQRVCPPHYHARAGLMVAVLSRDYFQSDWCRLELAIMHQREKAASFRTVSNPFGLILPVVIDDGDTFPDEVRAMQSLAFHEFANPYIRLDSPKQEALTELLRTGMCPTIERALERVPSFNPRSPSTLCQLRYETSGLQA